MYTMRASHIGDAVYRMIGQAGSVLRPDVAAGLKTARLTERSPKGQHILELLLDNAAIAQRDDVPICQDTGTVWVRIEVPTDVYLEGDVVRAINDAVSKAYRDQGLRMSLVHDALVDRRNTTDNTPAFIDIVPAGPWMGEGSPEVTVHVMLKGAGSDNASRLVMLNPDQGVDGIVDAVVAVVLEKASMACPPMIIGVGVGATFDKAPALAKKALLREVGSRHDNPEIARIEERLLAAVNATGMGPGGLGGDTTALMVAIESAPCHIAALPVAINLGCSALRSRTERLVAEG